MNSAERKKLNDYRRLSDREKDHWLRNASEQERADMIRLLRMGKFEVLQREKSAGELADYQLDRIMKLAGIESGLRKPPETNK